MPGGEFSLFETFVHLEDGPGASEVTVGDRFWEEIGGRAELQEGRLVTAFHWRPLQNSVEEKNAALWPLGQGGGAGVLPPLPLGEGWGEGGGRRGPRDLAEARPPSYAKVSSGGD